ncbi:prolyl hydroxylase family protein [Sinorhizobium meliloti]|uniref:prolyl hydroxylase family protein n=1 Tax=Rhizobium meliloti TaxID=382 RepID=UPI000FD8DF8E|nr:2OG-Fe(II) oxygenase [Sinorhizobium meliloti]RVE88356.1 2OG-Fe(II) oxygenase [Sinorhizobium meliloti]RVH28904.1 2OG-Fe(II) oxygenase [Sinorhizobium meliloti]
MQIDRPITGVRILRHCWSKSQCDEFISEIEKRTGWEAAAMGRYQDDVVVRSFVDKELRDVDVLNLEEASLANPLLSVPGLLEKINRELQCDAKRISRSMISRYSYGSHIKPHKDTGVYTTSRIATIVLYLNDNFEGGQIYFPDLSFEHRPRFGEILFFYSELRHGVRPVTSGVRYCVVGFAENDAAYKKII